MGPEFWVGLAAVFVAGGAVEPPGRCCPSGVSGSSLDPRRWPRPPFSDREVDLLRSEVADLGRMVQNLDARLEFQEQFLGGGLPTTQGPHRLSEPRLSKSPRPAIGRARNRRAPTDR